MWAIYDHPPEAPAHIVLRRWEIDDDGQPRPREGTLHATLKEARAAVPLGLVRVAGGKDDALKLVETYI